jgi:benzil reductase ((S)-benzoin forming)
VRHDRLAIVTGTSSGIGAAVATQLLADGWTVIGASRRAPHIDHQRYRHVPLDLANLPDVRRFANDVMSPALGEAHWQRIGLVNNAAATGPMTSLEDVDAAAFSDLLAVNTVAPVVLMGAIVRATSPGVPIRIVNVSTGAAVQAFPGIGEYGSSKAALRMASMIFAAEMASDGRPGGPRHDVAVLSYQPGIVDTPMQVTARAPRPWNQLFVDFHEQGRLVSPDEPAREIVAFLSSDREDPFTEHRYGAAAPPKA